MKLLPDKKHLIFWLLLLPVLSGFSQIVNIESQRIGADKEGWQGGVDFGLNITKNVSTVWQINSRAGAEYLKKKHRLLLLGDYNLVRTNGAEFVNSAFQHIRYGFSPGKKKQVKWEVFEQAQFNKIQKIQFRFLTGSGVRVNYLQKDSLELSSGTIPMFEYEELLDGTIERNFRISQYLAFNTILSKTLSFSTITYYQPNVTNFLDYRVSHESSLNFHVSERIVFKVIYNMVYDSQPPEDIPSLVYALNNSLGFSF